MNRARKVFVRMNLALLLCVVFAATRGWAQSQSPDDTETNQSATPQTQTGQQQQGQAANQDSEQSPGQNSEQSPTEMVPAPQMEPTPSDGAQENQTMTAAQIISILQADPDLLDVIKDEIAQESGVDPTTLTNRSVSERIRDSEQTRMMATKELVARGYSVNPEGPTSPTSTTAGPRTTTRTGRPTQPVRGETAPYENPDNPQGISRRFPTAICLRSLTFTLSFQRRGRS